MKWIARRKMWRQVLSGLRHDLKSQNVAKLGSLINRLPLSCPWFPASSAASQPSGRSGQSNYPSGDEESKTTETLSWGLNWIHLEKHQPSLKCKAWGRGRQELRLPGSSWVCWDTYFPQTWEKCTLLVLHVKWAVGWGTWDDRRFPKCHVETMLFSPTIRAQSTLHMWYKCKWTSCWNLCLREGRWGRNVTWSDEKLVDEKCRWHLRARWGGGVDEMRGEISRQTPQECKSVLRCKCLSALSESGKK